MTCRVNTSIKRDDKSKEIDCEKHLSKMLCQPPEELKQPIDIDSTSLLNITMRSLKVHFIKVVESTFMHMLTMTTIAYDSQFSIALCIKLGDSQRQIKKRKRYF